MNKFSETSRKEINKAFIRIPFQLEWRMRSAAAKLPVISLVQGSERQTAAAIRSAALEHGFFYVKDHGVTCVPQTFQCLRQFFEKDLHSKMKLHKSVTGLARGYIGLFEQGNYGSDETNPEGVSVESSALMDFKEVFHVGTTLPREHPLFNELLFCENVWPEGEDASKKQIQQYYDQVFNLSNSLMEFFALALDLPRGFFLERSLTTPMNSMNCVHYPPLSEFPSSMELHKDQFGIGEHSDFEGFTLLTMHGTEDPCLDIFRESSRSWEGVKPNEDMFVINIGDLLARWSGDTFRSTVHRARNHPRDHRYSIAFFRAPDFDCEISCAQISQRKRNYKPVLAGEHMLARVERANV